MIEENPLLSLFPEAEIPLPGVVSRLIQAGERQLIFMEFEQEAIVPPHSHNAQWGVVLDGEIELTIEGKTKLLKKGDSYYIEKDQVHSAKISAGYKDLTFFDQIDRYKIKE
ncbi:hypothetical protein FUAX_19270 [Fulvitalea axinellae]|uniref:Cupin type-2 domain-containing protein n=1 Tax=Fulvitalea axinellae TaxID=1182444 RepID=A0AAU9DAW5_9BACT|nr:hypothetical protein FUAX_19270 [Fulvitalea axinellae]